jgi:hypothetical protein
MSQTWSQPPSQPHTTLNIRELFESALKEYESRTGTKLLGSDNELATMLISCNSVDSSVKVLQEQAQKFQKFRGGDGKVMKWIKRIVHVLYTLSSGGTLAQGLVCWKAVDPIPNECCLNLPLW